MLIKFDKPIELNEARNVYNDRVKFVTTTESYPLVGAIEFSCDPKLIFKREALDPKVTKKINKLTSSYERRIVRIWNRSFKNISSSLSSLEKDNDIVLSETQKRDILTEVDTMFDDLDSAAEKPYYNAFQLGKLRGQVISNQELDDTVTDEDESEIEDFLLENKGYLSNFKDGIKEDLDVLLDRPYGSFTELDQAITNEVKTPKKSRALMYAAVLAGLVVAGTVLALKAAKAEEGHRVIEGGIWTIHPNEGGGGEVCQGCEENSGNWFSLNEFYNEYHTNNCLTNCRCDLRYMERRIAP